ncbi:MAG: DUF6655 family protein [Planctomycetaceae bacterium]
MQTRRFIALLAAASACGCTTTATSNTARTSTEQLLISNAVDQALDKVDFQPFAGHAIYLEEKYIDCVDKNYVIASLRHRFLTAGATLVAAADTAEIIVEARSGGVGTATSDSFIGTPELVLPGMLTLPEVRMITRTRQEGAAKIGIVAYNAKTKQVLGPGGQALAQSDNTLWYAAGVGPFRSGSLKSDVARSTTGRGAWSRETVPHYVAFNVPASSEDEPGRIQITGAEQQAEPAPPPSAPIHRDSVEAQ